MICKGFFELQFDYCISCKCIDVIYFWTPSSKVSLKSDREKHKSIVSTIYWIADAASKLPSYTGPKLDVYAFESVIFGIYSPRDEDVNPLSNNSDHRDEESTYLNNSKDRLNKGLDCLNDNNNRVNGGSSHLDNGLEENGTSSLGTNEDELNFLDIPTNIKYKEPKWKLELRAVEIEDQEPPVKPSRGLTTESVPDNRESFVESGTVASTSQSTESDSTAAADASTLPSDDDGGEVVLRQPSAARLRRMERKLGRGRSGPPTAAKPHTRSLSLPESTNVTLMRQNALDSNHNSATYEDLPDEEEEGSDMWRSSFTSWKMKRNQVASNVLERKAFREEVDTLEQNKGKKKPKTFKEIVEEKQRRENLLAKKLERKDLEKDEIQAILTSVDLIDSDDEQENERDYQEDEEEPEIRVERQEQQHTQLEPVKEPYPRANTLPTRGSKASQHAPHKPSPISASNATLPPSGQKAAPSTTPKPSYRPSAGAFQPYCRRHSLNERADYPDSNEGTATSYTTSPSPTATTPSEEAFPARSFHEKLARDRERSRERAEVAKSSQDKARRPTSKRLSMGIMGRVAAFNSGEAFKKEEEEGVGAESSSRPASSASAASSAASQPRQMRSFVSAAAEEHGGFTEHTITMKRRPMAQGGFGFTVTGGIDKKKPIVVKGIDPGSTAGRSELQIGDEILLINREKTKTFDHDDIQYSISQAVLSGQLSLKVRRYDDPSQRPRSVSTSSSSSMPDAQARQEMERLEIERRREEAERKMREEERRREEEWREEERRREDERRRRDEERRREEERQREERRREEERWREEQRRKEEQRRRDEEQRNERQLGEDVGREERQRLEEAEWRRRVEEERRRQEENSDEEEEASDDDGYAPKASQSVNALSRAKQLLNELGDDETSPEESPRKRGALTNGSSWQPEEKQVTRKNAPTLQDEELLEEEIMARLQREQEREEEREEVHRLIEEDEKDKSPIKETMISPISQKSQESVPSLAGLSMSAPTASEPVVAKPVGFRSIKGPRPFVPTNRAPEPFKPQPTASFLTRDRDIKDRVKKERTEFFSDEDVSPQSGQNVEDLWRRVEQPVVEATRTEEREVVGGVQRRMKPKNEADAEKRRSFNGDQERQRLEKWQKEQERIRQEQYEQEQRRLQDEREKDLQRAENKSKEKLETEMRALQERERMLQLKAQEEIHQKEEEMMEKERKERERRRLEKLAREEEERLRREEEERLRLEREERERAEQEQREREEAERRREEELEIFRRRKEEERRAKERERQKREEDRMARERRAREKIEKEKEEYEKLLKEREEEKERLAREQEERQQAAREREEKQRAIREQEEKQRRAKEEERKRIAKEREAKLRALREQEEERERLAQEQAARASYHQRGASEIIRPRVQQVQESAPPPSHQQPQQQQRYSRQHQSEEDIYKRIREEERERIRHEEKERLRREWEQLEKEKDRQRQEEEKLRREQAEIQRLAEQQRGLYPSSKALSDDVFEDDKVEMRNSYNRRKLEQTSQEDVRKPSPTQLGKDIMGKKMIPERDTKPSQVYMAKQKGDNQPTEQHWLVEEAKRRQQQGLLARSSEDLPIQPRKDSLDHEPVLERKLQRDVYAAPPYTKPYERDHRKNEPSSYEQEIPTRIPPPSRDQGLVPRPKQQPIKQQPFPHEQAQPPPDANRWDAPRKKYDAQPEFRHVQRRMHGARVPDPEQKQKIHNRRSMPDLNDHRSYAAPTARIMDNAVHHRGPPGVGAPPPNRVGGPPSPSRVGGQPPSPSRVGPGGDQRRGGPTPDNLIQNILHRAAQKKASSSDRDSPSRPSSSLSSHSDSAASVTSSSEMELKGLMLGSEPASYTAKTATATMQDLNSPRYDGDF